MSLPRRAVSRLLPLPVLLLVSGCTMLGYRLGTSLPPDIQVVHVPVFENATGEPGLDTEMTRATVQEFQREGSLSVSDAERSDVTVLVRLNDFRASALRYGADAVTAGEEYRFSVTADIQLIRTHSGVEIMRKTVVGEADADIAGDIVAAKQRVLPDVAANLGYLIVAAVVEYW